MITIGTARFDFMTDNESFARKLNGDWDSFFHTSFEEVVDEVLSVYNQENRTVTIDSLPIDLGNMDEGRFYEDFPVRLREALKKYCEERIERQPVSDEAGMEGVRIVSAGRNAFDVLSFFLLHGYFPFETDKEYTDLDFLLKKVIDEEAYRFREFLNSYGHYDFLSLRLVFQFSDEQLEQIVHVVQPSESIFISLYVRVQIHTYESLKRSDITRGEYRDVVWTLVLAYLFAESGGRFSRKQIILHTLRGVAAHLNFSMAEITRLLTEGIQELEDTVMQLPELWGILKEIRQDMQAELWALDGDYRSRLVREIISALRFRVNRKAVGYILAREHLASILSDVVYCRKLLQQLKEQEICQLVRAVIPADSEFVISYAGLLDKHKDAGTFSGKAGSEFHLLKWEFIFAVLFSMPGSTFGRNQFVLSVLQRLAAHYNLSVSDLIHWLSADGELGSIFRSSGITLVLQELEQMFVSGEKKVVDEIRTIEDLNGILHYSLSIRNFVDTHTEEQLFSLIIRLLPDQGSFIVSYAVLLDKGYAAGMLEGKAGGEFRSMKWEFIFSCFYEDNMLAFHQKYFVYAVLQRIAAHYNQEVTVLIGYYLHELTAFLSQHRFRELESILKELYEEHLLPMTDMAVIRSKTDRELESWATNLFGTDIVLSGTPASYMEKWLVFFLNERSGLFRTLWKAGQLNETLLLKLVSRNASLRSLWLRRIGDGRLLAVYRKWLSVYSTLRSRFQGYAFLESLGEFLSVRMVELTAKKYLSWSEQEIMDFLLERARCNIPHGFIVLLKKIDVMGKNEEDFKMMRGFTESADSDSGCIEVKNAGVVLIAPFLSMLPRRLDFYLSDDKKMSLDNSIRFVFVVQYLVYGKEQEWTEDELCLNKILAGIEDYDKPLPRSVALTENEIEICDELMKSIKVNWDKIRNTSAEAVRFSFFQRRGILSKSKSREGWWNIKVEERAFDVLLDSVPWGFGIIRYPWMEHAVMVKWR